jgi:hypothetical protein
LFEEVTEQSFDKLMAVSFKGAYFAALPLLRQRLVCNHHCVRWRTQGVADIHARHEMMEST